MTVSAPLRKALEVHRGLLTSWDAFQAAVGEAPAEVSGREATHAVDPFGSLKLWPSRNPPNLALKEATDAAWAAAPNAAAYARLPDGQSEEARIPVGAAAVFISVL